MKVALKNPEVTLTFYYDLILNFSDDLVIPNECTELTVATSYSIDKIKFPYNLEKIHFCDLYKNPTDNIKFPPNLKELLITSELIKINNKTINENCKVIFNTNRNPLVNENLPNVKVIKINTVVRPFLNLPFTLEKIEYCYIFDGLIEESKIPFGVSVVKVEK